MKLVITIVVLVTFTSALKRVKPTNPYQPTANVWDQQNPYPEYYYNPNPQDYNSNTNLRDPYLPSREPPRDIYVQGGQRQPTKENSVRPSLGNRGQFDDEGSPMQAENPSYITQTQQNSGYQPQNNGYTPQNSGYSPQNSGYNQQTPDYNTQDYYQNSRPAVASSGKQPSQPHSVTTTGGRNPQNAGAAIRPMDADVYFPNDGQETNDFTPLAATRPAGHRQQEQASAVPEVAGYTPSAPGSLSASANSFALSMTKLIATRVPGNLVISPLSLSILLALLQQGAKGASLQQLTRVVGMSSSDSRREYANLMASIKNKRSRNVLEAANGLWVDNEFDLSSSFKSNAIRNFNAEVRAIDFHFPGNAIDAINSWVNEKTKGHITNLLKSGTIDHTTIMVLVNAIYFKGLWKSPFEPDRTVNLTFSPTPVTGQETPFMHLSGSFVAGEDKHLGAKWLELPFEGNDYAMVFVLPSEQHGLEELLQKMTVNDFDKIINWENKIAKVSMSIPKFELGMESSLDSVLKQMGLTKIFSQNSGLDGISQNQPVFVSKVLQKAAITVDEFGSVAAVSTALAVNTLSLVDYYEEFRFRANQPFLAIIVDRANRIPLFVARINNPATAPAPPQRYSNPY